MTREAMEILRAARASDGDIMHLTTLSDPSVRILVGGRQMIPKDADAETVAAWVGGFKDLQRAGHVQQNDIDGDCFTVTREGFAALRAAESGQAASSDPPRRRMGFSPN